MKYGHLNEQLFGIGFAEHVSVIIPLATLQVETVRVAATRWFLLDILNFPIILEFEAKCNLIDCDCVTSGVVLQVSGEEGLREEETGNPKDDWRAAGDPTIKEINSLIAIFNPRGQWFKGQEALLLPTGRHLVIVNSL